MGPNHFNKTCSVAIVLSVLAASCVWAQTGLVTDSQTAASTMAPGPMTFGRNAPPVTSVLAEVVHQVAPSIVEIFADGQHLCLGTIVSKDGLIVTKASELAVEKMQCRLLNGYLVDVQLIATSEENDLALLQVDPEWLGGDPGRTLELSPIEFHDELLKSDTLQPGSFVVSVDRRDKKPLLGVISISGASFSISMPECADCADLGLKCLETRYWKTPTNLQYNAIYSATRHTRLTVQRVDPHSIAEQSGILMGDEIEQFNGTRVSTESELLDIYESLKPGDQVTFVVNRNQQSMNLSTTISRSAKREFQDLWGGGPFSRRRFGFSNILTHDIPIRPDQCGGPLVDLHGRTVGVNIARSLRVATLAIPINQVYKFVLANRPQAELVTK
jgi:serine protease Do